MAYVPIFLPGEVRGFSSSTTRSALPQGVMSLIQNARLGDGVITARAPDYQGATVTGSGGNTRGLAIVQQDGTQTIFAAIGNGSTVVVYASTDAGATFASITPATGAYGDTRLTDSNSNPVRFAVVKDNPPPGRTAYDCVVIFNGIDAPRIYAKATSDSTAFSPGAYGTSVVYTPPAVTDDTNFTVFTGFDNSFTVDSPITHTLTNGSAAGIELLDAGAASPNYMILTVKAAYAAGNSSTCEFTTAVNFSQALQLVLMADSSTDDDFWKKVKITLTDSSTNSQVIYDPSVGKGTVVVVNRSGTPSTWLVKQLAYFIDQGGTSTSFNLAAVKKITFAWAVTAPAAPITANIYMIAASGRFQGGANFALSYGSCDTRQEGPTTTYRTIQLGSVNSAGGTAGTDVPNIANDSRFYYDYHLYASNTSVAARNAGIDRAYAYVSLFGQTGYYQVASTKIARWTGAAWSFQGGATGEPINAITTANMYTDQDLSKPAPGADGLCLPLTTYCVAALNGHTFAAAASVLYVSDYLRPFVFRLAVQYLDNQPVITSGGSIQLSGETIQTMAPVGATAGVVGTSAPVTGRATLFFWTNYNFYYLAGFDAVSLSRPVPIGPHGTLSPCSIARTESGVYWLDQNGQVIVYDGAFHFLGLGIIDDKTINIATARKPWVYGSTVGNRYYMALTEPGRSLNDRMLVYYEYTHTWESEDTGTFDTLATYVGAYPSLVAVNTVSSGSHPAFFWEIAKPGATGSVAVTVTGREIHKGWLVPITGNAMQVVCDSQAAGTVTTSRTFPTESNTPVTGTISIAESTPRANKYDAYGIGGVGGSVYTSVGNSAAPEGWKLYAAYIQIEEQGKGVAKRD